MTDTHLIVIGEVSQRSGFSVATLRYYEQKGLITSVGRRGLHRLFDTRVLQQLTLISLGRSAGFTLEEIAAMFGSDGEPHIDRHALLDKADEIDDSIKRLTAMRDGLRHTAACRAADHLACPTFQKIMRVTAARGPRPAPRRQVAHTI